jgi:hypothetical protein
VRKRAWELCVLTFGTHSNTSWMDGDQCVCLVTNSCSRKIDQSVMHLPASNYYWVQAKYFVHTCYLIFYLKTLIFYKKNFLPSFSNSKQMKLLIFCTCIFSLFLASQSNLCLEKVLKNIPNNLVIFQGLRMVLVMKNTYINQNIYWNVL